MHQRLGKFPLPAPRESIITLDGKWNVTDDGNLARITTLKEDAVDFLKKCGVEVSSAASSAVQFTHDGTLPSNAFCLDIDDGRVEVSASTLAGSWAGWLHVEREMRVNRGLWVKKGRVTKIPLWNVQISQAPVGSNFLVPDLSEDFLSDDAFALLAHLGCNGMTIYGDWLFYVKSNIFPELNHPERDAHVAVLKDATERALAHGISLYFVPVSPKLPASHPLFMAHPRARGSRLARGTRTGPGDLHCICSSDGETLRFIKELWVSLFHDVPLLGGLILIIGGESYYHCYMNPARDGSDSALNVPGKTSCPSCKGAKAENVVANLVAITSDAVHEASPGARVMAWPYSATRWSADPYQIELIERYPQGVGLLSEIDKDQWIHRRGYSKHVWDYSVDFTGPSDRIVEQSFTCKEREIPLFVKTETALGLEFVHVPYVPCMDRLLEKWENVRSLSPQGVLQSWMFFGAFGSRAEELGWWTCWHGNMSRQEVLDTIARRDFGVASKHVLGAWKKMSEAIGHIPCIPPYFTGPFFLGPAHPLIPSAIYKIPDVFKGALYYKQENEESLSRARLFELESLVHESLPASKTFWGFASDDQSRAWDVFCKEMGIVVELSKEASDLMEKASKIEETLPWDQEKNVHDEHVLVEFMHRTFLTIFNTVRYLLVRDGQDTTITGEHHKLNTLKAIVVEEMSNVTHARMLYQKAPWLDVKLRFDARIPSSMAMIEAKEEILKGITG